MKNYESWLCATLAVLMLAGSAVAFVGCDDKDDGKDDKPKETTADTGAQNEDHRFDDIDYDGREFRIYTSIHVAATGMGHSSNDLIEGVGKIDGSLVNDAVFERNTDVERLLGVKLTYEHADLNYDNVPAAIDKLVMSNTDEYDLIINDLFPLTDLSIKGSFCNTLDSDAVFDFERSYWYKDYMSDLRLRDGYQYLLAGDYFIDIIRSAHLLLANKDVYTELHQGNADTLYDTVINYQWTYDKMYSLVKNTYFDKNANQAVDKGDRYGFMAPDYWGSSIPFIIGGTPNFISRDDDGTPSIALGECKRVDAVTNKLTQLFHDNSSSILVLNEEEVLDAFAANQVLFLGYQRLGSLENNVLKGMESDFAILPYPMLMESDKKYTTSTHDTTEVGAIMTTALDNMEFISTVVEVLNRETANTLMPKYYKEGLQVMYVDDSKAASMIDIIHDNFGTTFPIAYNSTLNNQFIKSISDASADGREYKAEYPKVKKRLNTCLNNALSTFDKTVG